MYKAIKNQFLLIMVALLVACGGGGGNAFLGDGNNNDNNTDAPTATSIVLVTDRGEIPSSGSAVALITALVRDANNNFVQGATVTFSASSGGIEVTQGQTNSSGRAAASLSAGGDRENRTITVTGSVSGLSASVDVAVVGTRLTLNGPTAMVLGDSANFEVLLEDSDGSGVGGQVVTLSSTNGNSLSASSLSTDPNGRVSFSVTAAVAGDDTISAAALGLNAAQQVTVSDDTFVFQAPTAGLEVPLNTDQDVRVLWQKAGVNQDGETVNFSTTRGVLAGASGVTSGGTASTTVRSTNAGAAVITAAVDNGPSTQVEVEFVATAPSAISVQAEPFSVAPSASSTITAVVRDAEGNFVKNQDVVFQLQDVSGGSLSQGSARTDSLGRAQTTYTASAATSAKDGVRIDAVVSSTPSVSGFVTLTVADQALHITIGTGNEVNTVSTTRYAQPYLLIVNDAAGNPVPSAEVQLSVQPLGYLKGCWEKEVAADETQPLDCGGAAGGSNGGVVNTWVQVITDVCGNEDVDNDGVLDSGEDFNSSGELEPGNPVVVVGSVTTGDDGTAEFTVDYPKDHSRWTAVRLLAQREVAGTEYVASTDFVLPIVETDVSNTVPPPGNPSPYGIESCNNPG